MLLPRLREMPSCTFPSNLQLLSRAWKVWPCLRLHQIGWVERALKKCLKEYIHHSSIYLLIISRLKKKWKCEKYELDPPLGCFCLLRLITFMVRPVLLDADSSK